MPFISEAASAIKSRFGFHDSSSSETPPVKGTPDPVTSASKDSLLDSSVIQSHPERGSEVVPSNPSFELNEDPSFWKDRNVQVIIRIRPLSASEVSTQFHNRCVRQDSCETITWTGHPESRFTFDAIADEHVSQEKLFKVAGLPMVDNCMGGYNSCMFAYGQTGSGKTYTMLGDIEGGSRRHSVHCGITPRVFECLFSRIQKEKEARREEKLVFICKCSFLEIYNEQIFDLLDPSSTNLQIREDTKKGIYVENLMEIEVGSARDVIQHLVQGAANRRVAATNMNRASSRSHSVFTCTVESKWESQGVTHHRFARLNLVDLAGSERQKSSGAEGDRLKEATNINKSLSTLGLVIMNLVNFSIGKSLHVPYRDSKLTFLLQDSLGGNSKTTIIANVSPSNCCALETLSTLKFAQRAKFIKNNAIVNEDASGDVLAMRMQINQLRREVLHLRSLVNGEENKENDLCATSFPASPGFLKLEGLQGSFSPLTRMAHKKDYDVALSGAFRRERDKDVALQALTAENQAAMQLIYQRGDEIQGLKMRLRLREAGIKRLEAVAAGKFTAEAHLLHEREELLKEIEVLRSHVHRNHEVTRFAMENLHLKEEIRRLKTFYEEGERELLNEQITALQSKLMEALDWKLMHEPALVTNQKENSDGATDFQGDGDLLISGQTRSPSISSINEENEFLHLQAIQNQAEMDVLHKKLSICLAEKEILEKRVDNLVKELENERVHEENQTETKELQIELPLVASNEQMDLKTMADAIATASQREAEAHERAIILCRENEELRMKLKVLIDDNNKLIELYERAIAEVSVPNSRVEEKDNEDGNAGGFTSVSENEDTRKVIESLQHQITDLHEENEKLMGLYEKAMQERDEFKRMVALGEHHSCENLGGHLTPPQKFVEIDETGCLNLGESQISMESLVLDETSFPGFTVRGGASLLQAIPGEMEQNDISRECNFDEPCTSTREYFLEEAAFPRSPSLSRADPCKMEKDECLPSNEPPCLVGNVFIEELKPSEVVKPAVLEDINLVRMKLDGAQEKISNSVKTATVFHLVEKSVSEIEKLSCDIKSMEDSILAKQQEFDSVKRIYSEINEKRILIAKKSAALKYSLSSSTSSVAYFEQREDQARAKVRAALSHLDQKNQELDHLQTQKNELKETRKMIQRSEVELGSSLACSKSKLDEQNRKLENERVLLAIDNIEKPDNLPSQRSWRFGGNATELLYSEEEKVKLQMEVNKSQGKLSVIRKELKVVNERYDKLKKKIQVVGSEVRDGLKSVEQMECGLENASREKEMLLEFRGNGEIELEFITMEQVHCIIEANLKDEQLKILDEDMKMESKNVRDLGKMMDAINERKTQLLQDTGPDSHFLSKKMEEELLNVQIAVQEAKSLLEDHL